MPFLTMRTVRPHLADAPLDWPAPQVGPGPLGLDESVSLQAPRHSIALQRFFAQTSGAHVAI